LSLLAWALWAHSLSASNLKTPFANYSFESKLKGYPDWRWNVVMYVTDTEAPTISEVLLLPTDSSLKAPAWVPWSERLADYQALQAELEAAAAEAAAAEAEEAAEAAARDSEGAEANDDKFVDFDEDDSALAADVDDSVDSKRDANDTGRKLPGFNLLRLLRGKRRNSAAPSQIKVPTIRASRALVFTGAGSGLRAESLT
jgi:hypothetical protein